MVLNLFHGIAGSQTVLHPPPTSHISAVGRTSPGPAFLLRHARKFDKVNKHFKGRTVKTRICVCVRVHLTPVACSSLDCLASVSAPTVLKSTSIPWPEHTWERCAQATVQMLMTRHTHGYAT